MDVDRPDPAREPHRFLVCRTQGLQSRAHNLIPLLSGTLLEREATKKETRKTCLALNWQLTSLACEVSQF